MNTLSTKNKISTAVAIILTVVIMIPCISIGIEAAAEKITSTAELKQIDEFEEQYKTLDGDSSLRLIVRSSHDIDPLSAVQTAEGWNNIYCLQFENKNDLQKAEEYYSSLDTVEYVEREILFDLCDDGEDGEDTDDTDNSISDTLDAKCYATANSNIDDALKMLDVYYPNPSQINVAVIDTGVENNDLFGDRLVNGEDSISDDLYHGSYVAGTVYYNTPENVVIYSYNATSSSGSISDVLASTSITKAVNQGCDVINMSFGSTSASTTFYNAIKSAYNNGVTIVAAAGNNGYDLDEYDYYPAEYSQVIAVGNMSVANVKYSSSNYNGGVNTYATGINVRSYYRGEDVYWSGTSASSPVIAAAAAIMLSADSSLTPDEIETAIEETEYSPNEDNTYRNIADAYSALSYVTGNELPTAEFEYTVTQNESTGFCDITFTCDDDTRIYYYISSAGLRACPLNTSHFSDHYQWDGESVVSMTKRCYMTVAAYSDTAKKSEIYFIALPKHTSDYTITSSSGAITYCSLEDSVIEVPETISSTEIVSLSKYSFSGMQNLETVILPESVTTISEYTFANCTNLKKVIALGVTQCSRYAFQNCTSLKEVIMPNVTTTYTGMFRNCSSLLICQMGDEKESLSTYNMAFYGSENAINYKLKTYAFAFDGFDGSGNIIYKSSDGKQSFTLSAEDALFLWNEYYINATVNSSDYYETAIFDSTAVFDVNTDGYVNVKDYALIYRQ